MLYIPILMSFSALVSCVEPEILGDDHVVKD